MWLLVLLAQVLVHLRKVVSISIVLTLGKARAATWHTSGGMGKQCRNHITCVSCKGPHTMVMALACLQSRAASPTQDLCQCAHLLQGTCQQCDWSIERPPREGGVGGGKLWTTAFQQRGHRLAPHLLVSPPIWTGTVVLALLTPYNDPGVRPAGGVGALVLSLQLIGSPIVFSLFKDLTVILLSRQSIVPCFLHARAEKPDPLADVSSTERIVDRRQPNEKRFQLREGHQGRSPCRRRQRGMDLVQWGRFRFPHTWDNRVPWNLDYVPDKSHDQPHSKDRQ